MPRPTVDLSQLIEASRKDCRVDVVSIAQKLGIEVYSVAMDDGKSGDICHDPVTKKTFIDINRDHPATRQRFTIAHELSHYLHHQDKLVERGKLDRSDEYKDAAEIKLEQTADKEAAAMLMPENIVEEYFAKREWSKKTKFSAEMIEAVADQFWVSRTMAVTRLRELHYPVAYLSFA